MGTAKRDRQKANRQLRLEEMQKEQQRSKNKKRAIQISVLLVLFVVGAVALSFLLSGDDDEDVATTDSTVATTVATDTTAPGSDTTAAGTDSTAAGTDTTAGGTGTTAAPATTVAGGSITGETPCPPADGSAERVTSFENPPPMCIDESKTYTAAITYEGRGTLTVALDAAQAPETVNNFVVLARYHFFDGTECHRAIPGFVVQCGDPTASGSGGPGYEFADELPEEGEYQIGSLAMANSGPDTNGSQFFLITGEDGASLPPNYSLFGQAEPGQEELIASLDALGNPDPSQNGVPPVERIVIESVTITES